MNLEDEKTREKLIRRFLPSLVILVVYFVFIKGTLNKQLQEAEKKYITITRKGISDKALPALNKKQANISASINTFIKDYQNTQQKLNQHTQFLVGTDHANKTLEILSDYFSKHQLHVTQENWVESGGSANLPRSFNTVKLWLNSSKQKKNPAKKNSTDIQVKVESDKNRLLEIQFYGSYQNTYEAMVGFANRKFKVIPVSLSMSLPDDSSKAALSGNLNWVLKLWF